MRASYGIGSRIRALTLALVRGESVEWQINEHCPNSFREIFPDGIDGLDVHDVPPGPMTWYIHRSNDGIRDALEKVWAALQLAPSEEFDFGVHYRRHHGSGISLAEFLPLVRDGVDKSTGPIPLLADADREAIISTAPGRFIPQASAEMQSDMDRPECQARLYLADLSRIIQCRSLVTNCPQSHAVWIRSTMRFDNSGKVS